MAIEEKVNLSHPVEIRAGELTTEITLRRPTVGDEEDAMDAALIMGRENNRITVELCTYAKITGLKYETLRSMDADDFIKIRNAYTKLLRPIETQSKNTQ